jgi:hypothetical protein
MTSGAPVSPERAAEATGTVREDAEPVSAEGMSDEQRRKIEALFASIRSARQAVERARQRLESTKMWDGDDLEGMPCRSCGERCVEKRCSQPPQDKVQVCPKQATRECTHEIHHVTTLAWAEEWWTEQEKVQGSVLRGAEERLAGLLSELEKLTKRD